MAQFAPNTNIAQGSPISAALLNGLVQAQGYVQTGGVPPTSASLVVTMPATQAVVPIAGGLSVWVSMTSGTITLPASNDSYIDLVATTSYPYTGSYVVASVANGAAAPAVAANGLRLCKVVTSGTAATAVSLLAPTTAMGAAPAVHVYGATNAASGFLVPLSMTSTRYDQGTATAQHDNGTNPSRLTCRAAGIYHISAQVFWQGSSAGTYRQVNLAVNGTNISVIFGPPSAAGLGVQIATDWSLAVNDYVEVYVLHDAGSVLATGVSTANELMWHRVG